MTSRPIDSKREEFRKYLERAGVMDALTKVLVMLYEEPEKPEDALDYVRTNLGDKRPAVAEIDAIKSDLESALARIQSLEAENTELKNKLNQMEGNEGVEPLVDETILAEELNIKQEPAELLQEDSPLPKRESTTAAEETPAAPVTVE